MKGRTIIAIWLFLGVVGIVYALRQNPFAATVQAKPAAAPVKPKVASPKPVLVPQHKEQISRIDIAFCLDTTGSMSGLIEGAKQKIWSIVNTVAAAKPKPELRIGLVAYRDRGDAYVTRTFDFTADLDAMYTQLRALSADGGGDTPEHVNQALHEAVHDLTWTQDRNSLKIVYLVGDAPPHMDYQDRYDYRSVCRYASKAGIIINTIQCGAMAETTPVWQQIARQAQGRFISIQQDGGMMAVASPYDADLARLSAELNDTYMAYGTAGADKKAAQELNDREAMAMSPETAAERAASKSSALYKNESWDLVDAIRSNKVQLEEVPAAELPAPLKDKSVEEQRAMIRVQNERRDKIQQQIRDLSGKRDAFVRKETEKSGSGKDGFDAQVLKTLKEQAKDKGIEFNR